LIKQSDLTPILGHIKTKVQHYSSSVIYAQVLLNDTTQITNAGSELALFNDTTCAGYATIQSGPAPGGFEIISAQKIGNLWMLKQMRIEGFTPGNPSPVSRRYLEVLGKN
jgi:hypothetical protein